jgi:uncharacterized protein
MNARGDRPHAFLKTPRTTVQRKPDRGSNDFAVMKSILDEAVYCHVGFVVDGQPYVVPTGFGREGRTLYIHGSSASRMLRALSDGLPACVTVTLLDGLVLARSAFHHSINYRSVMVLGVARSLDGEEKLRGLRTITEHMVRGRWEDVRPPTKQELKATSVLRLEIDEASTKVRQGFTIDEGDDLSLPYWAGVVPFALVPGAAVPEPRLPPGIALPPYLAGYSRPQDGGGDA